MEQLILEKPTEIIIKLSVPMLKQMFHPCEISYIISTCKGRCCEGTNRIMVIIHETEREQIEKLGGKVENGFILPDFRGLCPFKENKGTCKLHPDDKPFGCKASPFTLNKNNTLIIRNRYRLLRCYSCDNSLQAYKVHAWSLQQIFGLDEYEKIVIKIENSNQSIFAKIPFNHYQMLKDNDIKKRERIQKDGKHHIRKSSKQFSLSHHC